MSLAALYIFICNTFLHWHYYYCFIPPIFHVCLFNNFTFYLRKWTKETRWFPQSIITTTTTMIIVTTTTIQWPPPPLLRLRYSKTPPPSPPLPAPVPPATPSLRFVVGRLYRWAPRRHRRRRWLYACPTRTKPPTIRTPLLLPPPTTVPRLPQPPPQHPLAPFAMTLYPDTTTASTPARVARDSLRGLFRITRNLCAKCWFF